MTQFDRVKKELMQTQYTWLITGVAGFIGSNLLETLLNLKQKVIGLDNFATGSKQNIEDVLNNIEPILADNFIFFEGDICNPDDCNNAMDGVDYILHQAALGSVPRSIAMPELTHATNINGFLNILIAAKNAQVKRFIYASSSSVYGDSQTLPKVENEVGNPLSPYAVTKYTNELYAKVFSTCYNVETIGLRYFNVFGPRQNPDGPYAAVIPLWITALLKNEPVYIYGDGQTSRDFCYIENAIQANLLAAKTKNQDALNRVYNVTVGEQTTLDQLYEMISLELNSTQQANYRGFREGDIRYSLADVRLSEKLLGYSPIYSVADGLNKTIAWFHTKMSAECVE